MYGVYTTQVTNALTNMAAAPTRNIAVVMAGVNDFFTSSAQAHSGRWASNVLFWATNVFGRFHTAGVEVVACTVPDTIEMDSLHTNGQPAYIERDRYNGLLRDSLAWDYFADVASALGPTNSGLYMSDCIHPSTNRGAIAVAAAVDHALRRGPVRASSVVTVSPTNAAQSLLRYLPASIANPPVAPESCLAWLTYDETAGTEVTDYSPRAKNGRITAITGSGSYTRSASGNRGVALAINRASTNAASSVVLPASSMITTQLTLATWLWFTNEDFVYNPAIMVNGIGSKENTDGDYSWMLGIRNKTSYPNSDLALYLQDTSSNIYTIVSSPIGNTNWKALSGWTHVAATYSGTNASIYFNGALVHSTNVVLTIIPPRWPITIGGNLVNGVNMFGGLLDDSGIWSRALTASEVATLYNYPTPTVSGGTNALANLRMSEVTNVVATSTNYGRLSNWVDLVSVNFTGNTNSGILTNTLAGYYPISIGASFSGEGNAIGTNYEGAVFTNDVETSIHWARNTTSTSMGDANRSGTLYLPAGTAVDYRVRQTSGSGNMTIGHASLNIVAAVAGTATISNYVAGTYVPQTQLTNVIGTNPVFFLDFALTNFATWQVTNLTTNITVVLSNVAQGRWANLRILGAARRGASGALATSNYTVSYTVPAGTMLCWSTNSGTNTITRSNLVTRVALDCVADSVTNSVDAGWTYLK